MSHFSCFFFLRLFQNLRTPHNGTPPKVSPRLCGGFHKAYFGGGPILWGCRISKQSLKSAEMSHFSCILFLRLFEIRGPHTIGPPPKYPPDYVGVFSRGYVGGGPILWGCRISKQSLKTAEMSHISVVFLFKDCFEIRRPHTMGPPPKYPPDYCGGFYKGVCWGRSHSCVVLSNFETVFKNS